MAQAPWLVTALGLDGLSGPDPVARLASRLDVGRVSARAALFLAMAALSLLVVVYQRSRKVYVAVALVIILSMVVTPLADSHRIVAFGEQQAARRAAYEQRQERGPRPAGAPGGDAQLDLGPAVRIRWPPAHRPPRSPARSRRKGPAAWRRSSAQRLPGHRRPLPRMPHRLRRATWTTTI